MHAAVSAGIHSRAEPTCLSTEQDTTAEQGTPTEQGIPWLLYYISIWLNDNQPTLELDQRHRDLRMDIEPDSDSDVTASAYEDYFMCLHTSPALSLSTGHCRHLSTVLTLWARRHCLCPLASGGNTQTQQFCTVCGRPPCDLAPDGFADRTATANATEAIVTAAVASSAPVTTAARITARAATVTAAATVPATTKNVQ